MKTKLMQNDSEFNSLMTIEYMLVASENKYFDRKSAHIKQSDLALWMVAVANAEGELLLLALVIRRIVWKGLIQLEKTSPMRF